MTTNVTVFSVTQFFEEFEKYADILREFLTKCPIGMRGVQLSHFFTQIWTSILREFLTKCPIPQKPYTIMGTEYPPRKNPPDGRCIALDETLYRRRVMTECLGSTRA